MACIAGTICLLVFLRTLSCGFVNMDDHDYVLNNLLIRQLDTATLVDVFTRPHVGFWMPLTWISLALDYHFWGLNPLGYHLTNNILHAVNTGLVVLIADRIFQRQWKNADVQAERDYAYLLMLLLSGLLWGIHPLRVESVAWVTERKDVLNGLFSLSSVLCYLSYVRNREEEKSAFPVYLLSLAFFVCSLMAKPVSVLLPMIFLVLDWYPLDRQRKTGFMRLVSEKVPFLLGALAIVVTTLYFAKQSKILVSHDSLTLMQRVLVSGNAVFEYCRLMLFPVGIMPLHIIDASAMAVYSAKSAVVAVSCLIIYRFRQNRGVVAAAVCFILPLLPVLAFFQNGLQAFAARFTYLPSVAPTILICGLSVAFLGRNRHVFQKRLRPVSVVVAALLAVLAVSTYRQIGVWKSTETVWSRIIEVKPSGRAYKERSIYYLMTGNYPAALDDLTLSLEFASRAQLPEIYNLYAYRGEALLLMGRNAEALDEFNRALAICRHASYFARRGQALEQLGRTDEAAGDLRRAGNGAVPLKWLERNACD